MAVFNTVVATVLKVVSFVQVNCFLVLLAGCRVAVDMVASGKVVVGTTFLTRYSPCCWIVLVLARGLLFMSVLP